MKKEVKPATGGSERTREEFGLCSIQPSLPCRIKEPLFQGGLTNNPRITLE